MSMNSSSKLASFAPYTPPPDDPSQASSSRASRTWFPSSAETSYQSGGVPTFGTSVGGRGSISAAESQQSEWESRLAFRIDALAAFAYLLGPVSAFIILILETQNDYVRFNAYQSALLTGPLLVIRILMSLIGFWQWLRFLFTLLIWVTQIFMVYQAFVGASGTTPTRYYVPYIGFLAEDWVSNE